MTSATVAQVYVDDPEAWPLNPCAGCGYRRPVRAKRRADGAFRMVGYYEGDCPSCGLDSREGKDAG